mmetsp:Transcript_10498/g.21125  ORF Transcript_10498/g.21125 Transcript_10498/m.21125 type:complete len:696 (-) Transcript_10498:1246-3333(-)
MPRESLPVPATGPSLYSTSFPTLPATPSVTGRATLFTTVIPAYVLPRLLLSCFLAFFFAVLVCSRVESANGTPLVRRWTLEALVPSSFRRNLDEISVDPRSWGSVSESWTPYLQLFPWLIGDRVVWDMDDNETEHMVTRPFQEMLIHPEFTEYPRNLNRVYDGRWESSIDVGSLEVVVMGSRHPKTKFSHRSGFILLTAENYESELHPDVHYLTGDVLVRDGAYRSQREFSMRVMGIYEWKVGRIVFVGDVLYDAQALNTLYEMWMSGTEPQSAGRNVTKQNFLSQFSRHLEEYRRSVHPSFSQPHKRHGIPASCPFTGFLTIHPGRFLNLPLPSSDWVGRGASQTLSKSTSEEFVEMSGSLISTKCETSLNLTLSTQDAETQFGKATVYTLLVTMISFVQVLVLIRQMETTSTQAGASRVSLMTIGLQAVADSYLCLGHLTMGIAVQSLFHAFATAAFFKFIIFSIFEMRYMLMIWKARRPAGFSEGWDAMRRELSMLYSRFYGSLLFGIVLLYQMQSRFHYFVYALYSFWVPQIVLSVVGDHRRPLHPVYIIGMSATRLLIPMYFWSCPKNFLHIQPQSRVAIELSFWMFLQTAILLSQHKLGPRWFVPKRLLPEKYNYYRSLSIPGLRASNSSTEDLSSRDSDCLICMHEIRGSCRDKMSTPCDHVFHEECLQQWMDVKMECPTCRRSLPPP